MYIMVQDLLEECLSYLTDAMTAIIEDPSQGLPNASA
jgi:hypothetical protein